jgi:hypothetical protein
MLLEDNNPPRQIHTDGRKHPADVWPSWMGYSIVFAPLLPAAVVDRREGERNLLE